MNQSLGVSIPQHLISDPSQFAAWVNKLPKKEIHELVHSKDIQLEAMLLLAKQGPVPLIRNLVFQKIQPEGMTEIILKRVFKFREDRISFEKKKNFYELVKDFAWITNRDKQLARTYLGQLNKNGRLSNPASGKGSSAKNNKNLKKDKTLSKGNPSHQTMLQNHEIDDSQSKRQEPLPAFIIEKAYQILTRHKREYFRRTDTVEYRIAIYEALAVELCEQYQNSEIFRIPPAYLRNLMRLSFELNSGFYEASPEGMLSKLQKEVMFPAWSSIYQGISQYLDGVTDPARYVFKLLVRLTSPSDEKSEEIARWFEDTLLRFEALKSKLVPEIRDLKCDYARYGSARVTFKIPPYVILSSEPLIYWKRDSDKSQDVEHSPVLRIHNSEDRDYKYQVTLAHLEYDVVYCCEVVGMYEGRQLKSKVIEFTFEKEAPRGRAPSGGIDWNAVIPYGGGGERRFQQN